MSNLVCTVVAKNYLAIAKTLGDSIKKNWSGTDFIIVLSDELSNEIDLKDESHKIVEAKDFNIPRFDEMAFKYNVIEFSTAIKPFVFEKLMREYSCDNFFYIDPDMYVYRPLTHVLDLLESKNVVLTPHVLDKDAKNDFFELETLGAGVYNLGFIALKNNSEGIAIVKWWQQKLVDYCFFSKREYLFYDQKWMVFLPIYFEGVSVLQSKAYNIARWNFAERKIIKVGGEYCVKEKNKEEFTPIMLFHFSGYKPGMKEFGVGEVKIEEEQEKLYWELFVEYGECVKKNGFDKYISLPYKYDYFENGDLILPLHRRLYREMTNEYVQPFSVGNGTFWELMERNKMLLKGDVAKGFKMASSKKMKGFNRKLRLLDTGMRILKKVVGVKNYSLFLKYFNSYCYEERQKFLLTKQGMKDNDKKANSIDFGR